MKVEELKCLMVGNQLKDHIDNWFMVDGVDYQENKILTTATDQWYDCSIFDFIPLTEDIILKSGFIEVYRSKIHATYDKDGHGEIGVSFQYHLDYITFRYYGKDIKIQYVHELQNLYLALIGEELKTL